MTQRLRILVVYACAYGYGKQFYVFFGLCYNHFHTLIARKVAAKNLIRFEKSIKVNDNNSY